MLSRFHHDSSTYSLGEGIKMSVSLSDRATAGATYAAAFAAMLTAYVDLAAKELALDREGIALDGGRFGGSTNNLEGNLYPWRHPQFAPTVDKDRLTDLIMARLAQL
jgi:hypothetical protein